MDGRTWLGLGPRARTPQVAFAPTPSLGTTKSDVGACAAPTAQHSLQRSLTQVHIQQPSQKTARLSRISSYIGLGNSAKAHATTAVTTLSPEQIMERSDSMSSRTTSYHEAPHDPTTGFWSTSPSADSAFLYKESDQTWHNPNLTQMMDTVSSNIMSNGIAQPIPRHLNSFVVGMIEEFRIRLSKQRTLEADFEELRRTHKKEIREFAAMADEWKHREAAFNTDIRRMEQFIADRLGVSSVVLARAGRAYNRNNAKVFQANLNRLSKSEDENTRLEGIQQVVMESEMRNFAVMPITKDTDREIVLDLNSDAFMSELWRPDAKTANKRNADLLKRMSAAQQFFDDNGRPRAPSDNGSKQTSPQKSDSSASSSGVASSASSSLITQGFLGMRATQDHVTPHTTPPCPEPAKPYTGASAVQAPTGNNALATIQELMKINGGLPEDAIDDESSYGSSFVGPRHERSLSLDAGDDKSAVNYTCPTAIKAKEGNVDHNGPQRPHPSTLLKPVPGQLGRSDQGSNNNVPVGFKHQKANESPSSSSSQSSKSSQGSCRSSTLMAMAHNCIDHAGQPGGPECPRNSPTRKVQSGADPFPDEATKYKYRSERTVLNAHIREVAYLTNQELRTVMDDRSCRQPVAPVVRAKIVHNANVPRTKGTKPAVRCPPGFEAQAAAGLLPYQQAAAKKAASRKAAVRKAASDLNKAIQGKAHALGKQLTGSTWEEDDDDDDEA